MEVTLNAAIQTIAKKDPQIKAFLTHCSVSARSPISGPLAGVPFSLKDIWDVAGLPTTAGSVRFIHQIAAHDGVVAQTFKDAGAVLMGKTSLSDLSVCPDAINYIVGYTRNPHDHSRTSGGSSGGAAAAVASEMVEFDWCSDIGGSIRMPAAFCGVLGLRLSTQNWPVQGIFPKIPPSLNFMCGQGPIARTIARMREVLKVAAPALSQITHPDFSFKGFALWRPELRGEWPKFFTEAQTHLQKIHPDPVSEATALPASRCLRNAYIQMWGAHFLELFDSDKSLTAWQAVSAVLSAVFLRGKTGDHRIHPSTAELFLGMMLTHFTLFRSQKKARAKQQALAEIAQAYWNAGKIIVMPTSLYSAPKLGRTTRNPHILSCVVFGNLVDAAALTIPFGKFPNGMPRGIQLLGPPGSEWVLLDWAEKSLSLK